MSEILLFVVAILKMLIIVQVIFSWLLVFNIISIGNRFVRSVGETLELVLDPLYRPIRRVIPIVGSVDFSPLVLWLILRAGEVFLWTHPF